MLTVRPDQFREIEHLALRRFEDELLAHCHAFAPRLSERRGEESLRGVVRSGMQQAAGYGFTNRGPMRLYVELLFTFGAAFDSDPQYPWAGEILGKGGSEDQMARSVLLHRHASDYLRAVAGEDNRHLRAMLQRVIAVGLEDVGIPCDAAGFEAASVALLRPRHPEKAAYVGDGVLRGVIARSLALAREHGIMTPDGVGIVAGLIYGFGHGIIADPLYPWVAEALGAGGPADPAARVPRLIARTVTYVGAALTHLQADG